MFAKTIALALLAGVATAASAVDFSYAGMFVQDNDKVSFNFSVGATSNVTLVSFSYAGGVNSLGQTIARGGFDPILSLYNSAGALIQTVDDGSSVFDPVTNRAYDTYFNQTLSAGTYTVFVTQYDNFGGATITSPFRHDGEPNFRNGFIDAVGNKRDGHWGFDIKNVSTAVQNGVPEPATWALMLVGFGAVGAGLRRQRTTVRYTA